MGAAPIHGCKLARRTKMERRSKIESSKKWTPFGKWNAVPKWGLPKNGTPFQVGFKMERHPRFGNSKNGRRRSQKWVQNGTPNQNGTPFQNGEFQKWTPFGKWKVPKMERLSQKWNSFPKWGLPKNGTSFQIGFKMERRSKIGSSKNGRCSNAWVQHGTPYQNGTPFQNGEFQK